MEKLRLNLQLFADPNNYVQTTILNDTEHNNSLTDEMKTTYSKYLIERAQPQLVHAQFGEKEALPKNGGKTIEWREWSALPKATTPLREGVTPEGVPINVTTITQTLQEFGAYTTYSDTLELTAIDNVIVEITGKHADAMALTLDDVVRNELNSGSNGCHVIYAPKANGTACSDRDDIDATCKLTPTLIAQAATQLKKMNAPKIDGSYVCIIHPSVSYDLTTCEGWIDIQKYSAATNIFEGEIGKLYNVRFVETTEAKVWRGTGDDCAADTSVYSCLFFGKGAYKVLDVANLGAEIIVKAKGSAGAADPLNQRGTIGWKIPMFGAKVVIPDYLVRVECGSSFSATDPAN